MGILPHQITDLLALHKERHNYNTTQTDDLQINAQRVKFFINCLSFMLYIIWNHISLKNPIDVSYACFKHLTKAYLQNNDTLYRAR